MHTWDFPAHTTVIWQHLQIKVAINDYSAMFNQKGKKWRLFSSVRTTILPALKISFIWMNK